MPSPEMIDYMDHLEEQIQNLEADRDRWKTKAELLERAIKDGTDSCFSCVHRRIEDEKEYCRYCNFARCKWEFNEAKYKEATK